jgi:hypothetical protein
MLSMEIPINIFLLATLLLAAALIGLLFRQKRIKKLKKRVGELEKELLSNYSDILEFQKEKKILEQKLKDLSSATPIPVIPILSVATDETKADKLQDMAIRKKLLSQQSAEK